MLASSVPEPDIEPDDQPTVSNTQEELGVTVTERAARTAAEGRVKLDSNLQVFIVNSILKPRVVCLFPTVTCSCSPIKDCYHIVAAQMSVGMSEAKPRRKVNLT